MTRPRILVSVVMPCLNEARTLAVCLDRAHAGCRAALDGEGPDRDAAACDPGDPGDRPNGGCGPDGDWGYEIIIADNGSDDGSPAIATGRGARVVPVTRQGYGEALLGGIAEARGEFVVMADSDGSYDFAEIPRFVAKLRQGYDLVMGNRFAGEIKPGAMPWHHRYIGNPLLSGLGRLLYRPGCRDFHCGLRAFRRDRVRRLGLRCPGMEFASEMVIRASRQGLRITELPIVLHPDGRGRAPHLRSFADGWRHLKLLLTSVVA